MSESENTNSTRPSNGLPPWVLPVGAVALILAGAISLVSGDAVRGVLLGGIGIAAGVKAFLDRRAAE